MTVHSVPERDLGQAYAHCQAVCRAYDKDRYAAALFAPAERRPHLFALYAFNAEISRVRETVSDPLPGEMRFQWWRDLLKGGVEREPDGNPVAAALLATMHDNLLPIDPFLQLIEARTFDLYDDPMPAWLDLEGYCGETSSALIRLSAIILAKGGDMGCADCCGHAGVAFALTGILRAFPWHSARGQVYVPDEHLKAHGAGRDDIVHGRATPQVLTALAGARERVREHMTETRLRIAKIPGHLAPAFLPVCLVDPCLKAMEAPGYDPFRTAVSISPVTRLWRMWSQSRCAARAG